VYAVNPLSTEMLSQM